MSSNDVILNKIMEQVLLNYHPTTIVSLQDIVRAVDVNSLLSSFIQEDWELYKDKHSLEKIKKLVEKYPQYFFTTDALHYLDNYLRWFNQSYPTKKDLLDKFSLFTEQIDKMYETATVKKKTKSKFSPKDFKINPNSTLFHTTNSFELFEQDREGTPYRNAWFNIDSIYKPENIYEFHPKRGGMRVIGYKWIGAHPDKKVKSSSRLTKTYPFLDSDGIGKSLYPKIMDARKITTIPKDILEEYLSEKGLEANLHEPDLTKNILEQYGFTWKPIVIEFLKSKGYDGVIADNQEIVIFEPDRWLFFDSIEQSDDVYLASTELVEKYLENKELYSDDNILNYQLIPEIASKYNVDRDLLQMIFNRNKKFF